MTKVLLQISEERMDFQYVVQYQLASTSLHTQKLTEDGS